MPAKKNQDDEPEGAITEDNLVRSKNPSSGKRQSDLKLSDQALESLAGHWGRGLQRRERLEAEGYDADKVQDEINQWLNS
jgi:CW_7 repeat